MCYTIGCELSPCAFKKSKYWPIRIPGDPPLGRDPGVEKHCITYHYLALVPYFPDYKSIWSINRASIMMNKKNPNKHI